MTTAQLHAALYELYHSLNFAPREGIKALHFASQE